MTRNALNRARVQLSLAPDVLAVARSLASAKGVPLGNVIDDAVRAFATTPAGQPPIAGGSEPGVSAKLSVESPSASIATEV
jgi:hypothetical protein